MSCEAIPVSGGLAASVFVGLAVIGGATDGDDTVGGAVATGGDSPVGVSSGGGELSTALERR